MQNAIIAPVAAAIVSDAALIGPVQPAATVVATKAKRVAKPKAAKLVVETVAAKPAAKPIDPAAAKAASDRIKLLGNARTLAASIYNDPSLSVRRSDRDIGSNPYAALFAEPKHRTTIAKLTIRDDSAVAVIVKHSDKLGTFNPSAFNLDRGNFSRLVSVGFIVAATDGRFKLSATGAEYSRVLAKRLKAA